jgi:hypothetical protein
MIKVQTLSPPESSSAATTGKPSRHQTSVRYSCRRHPRVHKPPDRTNRDRRERPGLTDASRSELINSWTWLRLTPSIAALSRSVNNIRSMIIFPSVGHRWSLVGVSASPTGDGVVSAWPSWASLRPVLRIRCAAAPNPSLDLLICRTASLRPLIRKGASRELPTSGQLSVRKELNVIPARSACRGNRTVPVTALAGVPSITTTPFFRTGCCPDATRQ